MTVFTATITCPSCGHHQSEDMPENACVQRWVCPKCGETATPKKGDCCVFCSHADNRCPPEQEREAVLPKPGAIGLAIRLLAGVGLTYLGIQAIQEAPSYFDGYTNPWGSVLPVLVLAYFTRPVVNELVQRPGGWWPTVVPLGALAVAVIIGATQGTPFGPVYGIALWVWTVLFLFLLGPAFLLAVLTRTPGCEMRSFANLWARIRGKEPKQAACPGFIDKWDHVRLFGKW